METGKEEIIKTYRLTEKDIASFLGDLSSRGGAAVEATGSTELLREQIASYVKRFVVVAPGQFEDIRHSINKTDRYDARALAFFLSKDILPEARSKDRVYQQLSSTAHTHNHMVKLWTSLFNQVHGILNHYGIKAKKEKPTTKKGFQTEVRERARKPMIQVELEVIDEQIQPLLKSIKHLEKGIISFAQALPGFKNLLSIKGIGSLSVAILLPVIGSIKDFESDKKIAAYFGIIPKVLRSNETCHMRRITKRRSTVGRFTLAQCTFIAKRYSQYLNTYLKILLILNFRMDNQHRRRKSFMKKTILVYALLFVSFFSQFSLAMEEEEFFLKTISKGRTNVDNRSKLEKLPGEILEAIYFELKPKDIVNLSMVSSSLRALTTDKFWERYIRVHHQKKWSSSIPAIKVAFAYSLFDRGKILQAAQLGFPKARTLLEYGQTTKKRVVENSNKKEDSFLEQTNNLVRNHQLFPFFPFPFVIQNIIDSWIKG